MILMFCTGAKGGMLSVVDGYRRSGLFADCDIRLVVTHDTVGVAARLLMSLRALSVLLRALIFERVSGVHLHAAMRGSFWRKSLYGLVARAFGVPVIYHLHGSEMKPFVEGLPTWARRWVIRLLENANAVIVLSTSWQDYVEGLAPRATVVRVPNYVSVDALPDRPVRATVDVLFLGALGRRKGIYDLLPAFAQALATQPDLHLTVGGDGELAQAQALADTLGVQQNVSFLGWVSGEVKQQALERADIFVLPSYNEGLPMSILEAMAQGLPVIATRVGGIPEAVMHGQTGLLFDAGDQAALREALLELARLGAGRAAMGQAGYALARQVFSEQAVVPQIKHLYRELGMV